MNKFPSPKNKWIQQKYAEIETMYRKKRTNKHKLTRKEFLEKMKGETNDKG